MTGASEDTALLKKPAGKLEKKGLSGGYVGFEESNYLVNRCFACIGLYLAISVIAYSYFFNEQWSVIDSLYFSVVTFTTVGYGDLCPQSTVYAQIFAMLYIFFGICIVAFALGIIGEKYISDQEDKMKEMESNAQKRVIGMIHEGHKEEETKVIDSYGTRLAQVVKEEFPFIVVLVVFALLMGHIEDWPIIDSLYYGMVTFTTVGYGDYSPETQKGRALSVLCLPIFVLILARFLGKIADIYMDMQNEKTEEKFLHRELTLKDISAMDTDNDNEVSLAEFLSFMLVAMQKVDKELIDELTELFNVLDKTGDGALSKEDLMAKTKQNSPKKTDVV